MRLIIFQAAGKFPKKTESGLIIVFFEVNGYEDEINQKDQSKRQFTHKE